MVTRFDGFCKRRRTVAVEGRSPLRKADFSQALEKRMRARSLLLAAVAAAAIGGCNAARQPQIVPPGPAGPPPARMGEALPPDAPGCAGAVARYRSVIDNDLAMGHVNKSVHAQISNEIGEAASACSSGQDGRALSLLRASKSRHGYPG
jgi:hypothetical protein